jgi:diguanylate cyclase (GGDEF)-like protein
VAVAGRPIGVIHVGGEEHDPASDEVIASVSLIAQRAGAHIGLLRATARTETQARTDSLTGLYNRRSIEAAAHHLVREGTPFVAAFADLDQFKVLNDKHGHETGDRVLRLFARVLRDSVRPTDIPARYGGEEFVVVLPDCSVTDAITVAERLRSRLREAIAAGSVPPFTVSVGIAHSGPDNGLTETIGRADEALLAAKAAGRDRVFVFPGDDPDRVHEPDDEETATTETGDGPSALRLGA